MSRTFAARDGDLETCWDRSAVEGFVCVGFFLRDRHGLETGISSLGRGGKKIYKPQSAGLTVI